MLVQGLMARKFLVALFNLPVRLLLARPKQLDAEAATTDDVQTRGRRIWIHIVYPHDVRSISLSPPPCLAHLPGLADTFSPHNSVTSFIETCIADSAVVAPSRTLGCNNARSKVFDDAIMFDRLEPVSAAGGYLVDHGGRSVGHIQAPRRDDKEIVTMLGERSIEFAIRPERIEEAGYTI